MPRERIESNGGVAGAPHARALGYRELRLDTLPSMTAVPALYQRLSFVEISASGEGYLPGTRFYAIPLDASSFIASDDTCSCCALQVNSARTS